MVPYIFINLSPQKSHTTVGLPACRNYYFKPMVSTDSFWSLRLYGALKTLLIMFIVPKVV
jgi:hypothetical protein